MYICTHKPNNDHSMIDYVIVHYVGGGAGGRAGAEAPRGGPARALPRAGHRIVVHTMYDIILYIYIYMYISLSIYIYI